MNWEESKLRTVVWITVAMLAEAILLLWPLGTALTCMGIFSTSISIIKLVVASLVVGFSLGLALGIYVSLAFGLIVGLSSGFGAIFGAGIPGDIGAGVPGVGFDLGLFPGFVTCFFTGLAVVCVISLIDGFSGSFGNSLGTGLAFGTAVSLALGLLVSLALGLVVGLVLFAVIPLGILLFHWVRNLGASGIESVKQFLTPWRSERLYFGRSVVFVAVVYLGFVLLFALWFYASYLNANKVGVWLSPPNPYFNTENIMGLPNYWTFVYFSFITIASLGYGDIFPIHWVSQILVILETMVAVGLIAGFLAMIITVGGRDRKQSAKIDPYVDTDL